MGHSALFLSTNSILKIYDNHYTLLNCKLFLIYPDSKQKEFKPWFGDIPELQDTKIFGYNVIKRSMFLSLSSCAGCF